MYDLFCKINRVVWKEIFYNRVIPVIDCSDGFGLNNILAEAGTYYYQMVIQPSPRLWQASRIALKLHCVPGLCRNDANVCTRLYVYRKGL